MRLTDFTGKRGEETGLSANSGEIPVVSVNNDTMMDYTKKYMPYAKKADIDIEGSSLVKNPNLNKNNLELTALSQKTQNLRRLGKAP